MIKLMPHTLGLHAQSLPSTYENGIGPGMRTMGAPRMWEAGFDGSGITAGIIDSGIDDAHADLKDKLLGRRDYVQDGRKPQEFHPHGTHVAGIVAANGALKGMAAGASLRDYRVLNAEGSGTWEGVSRAVLDAITDGCDLINLSLGGPEDVYALHEAIRQASQTFPVIVAVGNDGVGHVSYPGYYPEVIGAGAGYLGSDGKWQRAWFSNTNPEVDVLAPGSDILSCAPGGGYVYMSGTSQGAPHVAGFMALLLQRGKARLGRKMTEPAAWESLKCSTVDVDALGIDASTGAGFVTIYPSFRPPMEVQVQEGSNLARVDGIEQELVPGYPEAVAETRNGFFSLPMAFVTRIWGGSKGWNEQTQTGTFWIPRDQ